MWEKCTICNGKGLDPNYFINNNTPKCPVCKGKRIINTLTGNPPVDDVIETETSNINKVKYRGGLDEKKYSILNKNPILKGCRNKECFCTGECKKIVGYKEDYKKNSLSASDFAKLFYGTFKGDSGPR